MDKKDERIKVMNEVLNGMKVLKLYAWEWSFHKKINTIRDEEIGFLRKDRYLGSVTAFSWMTAPTLVCKF